MSMIIAHNMAAINTQRQFGVSARGMSGSMEKLSSGFKINTGKDDPSGLLISEKLRSQLTGIQRAKQNTEEAMNVMGIAEGALAEMNNILKKMKSLATHSANSGVTSADQVAADQAELDSGIQTMDRIAQTTKFSNDNILNGAKELDFTVTTNVKGTQQNGLVNERDSTFDQIFKRAGYSVSISYVGGKGSIGANAADYSMDNKAHAGTSLTADGRYVNFAQQANKAYLEVDTASPDPALAGGGFPAAQVKNGVFTQDQQFTLTGSIGSRQFSFSKNSSVTDMVKDIHATVGATGVDASLVFNSAQSVDKMTTGKADSAAQATVRTAGDVAVFGSYRHPGDAIAPAVAGAVAAGCTGVTKDLVGVQWGRNTDGQGNIYIKYVSNTEVEYYKDSSMSPESKVAVGRITGAAGGAGTASITAVNNSGLSGEIGVYIPAAADPINLPDVRSNYISTGGIEGGNASGDSGAITWSGNIAKNGDGGGQMMFDYNKSVITGIELGTNTSADGRLFFRTSIDEDGLLQVSAYKDESMSASALVAQSAKYPPPSVNTVTLDEVRDRNDSNGTGLGIVLSTQTPIAFTKAANAGTSYTGNATFNNLGARIYASEYGSEHYIKIVQDKGAIFTSYDSPGNSTRTLLDAGETGASLLMYGQDATISVNGQEVRTNGLQLKVATQDIQANLTFNAGKPGSTTIAQVGYGTGSPFTKVGMLNEGDNKPDLTAGGADYGLSAYICNAGHNTNETIGDFQGGMQLQLGEGAGDQNRTVVSLRSMTTENIGRVTRGGYWDSSNPSVYSNKTFTLKDCLGGGSACLSDDPTLTMAVIDQAIEDVAAQRALIGAMQANLLQTNANNLDVTFENVTKTESGIRDADMAAEMAEFTKNQVLQNAAMSMMGQANQQSQSVMQLLQ